MLIMWDEPKRRANLEKHGVDFADIDAEFFLTAIIRPAKMGCYSAIGYIGGVITVIFAELGTEAFSIVSARPASIKERMMWQ